jgi:hypothetical protein
LSFEFSEDEVHPPKKRRRGLLARLLAALVLNGFGLLHALVADLAAFLRPRRPTPQNKPERVR